MPAHLRPELVALSLFVIAALFIVGLLTWSSGSRNIVGVVGGVLAQLFGAAAWLVPIALIGGAAVLLVGARSRLASRWASPAVPAGLALLLLGLMGFVHLFVQAQRAAERGEGGGYVGLAVSTFLSDYLTPAGAGIVLLALALTGFMLAFGFSLAQVVRGVSRPTLAVGRFAGRALGDAGGGAFRFLRSRQSGQPQALTRGPVRVNGSVLQDTASLTLLDPASPDAVAPPFGVAGTAPPTLTILGDDKLPPGLHATDNAAKSRPEPVINISKPPKKVETGPHEPIQSPLGYVWHLPTITLLQNITEVKVSQADIKTKIRLIEDALQSFKVEAVVREVNTGPAVTQFAIEPGVGVRVNRITALDKDLALALAAPDIRIEAPIPGQSRVGIEVPNAELQVVGLRAIMESEGFARHKGRLKIAMGRDTHGQPVITDLAKLPHILVAGSTGSGKSVFLNSMVIGFLMQFTPDDLRMLMIDPKRVELTPFNGIPHLLRPVVTDIRLDKDQRDSKIQNPGAPRATKIQNDRERPMTAVEALKWALWEMERRYKVFAKGGRDRDGMTRIFRNIEQYRDFMRDSPEAGMEHLPYIVIIIDELADLMLTAPEEVETSLCRLAQLARATGIHLVVATQRPSVDVVTGLIKANFPARIAFAVTSQVDSKVILDGAGAEKLLGRGDMLYTASDESRPVRIQGTFVSDREESQKVVDFWRKQLPSEEEIEANGVGASLQPMQMPDWLGKGNPDEDSELLEQAIELVKRNSYVSTSMLQRKLRVGYNRAARLIEQMEEMGMISPADADNRGRPREVLLGAPDDRLHPQTFDELDDE
jgi:S-DNA-T family DNA segregation ATPase FtsK/SpoIIIE